MHSYKEAHRMDNDSDYWEAWDDEETKLRHRAIEFLFREAGVDRINDEYDDDEADEERS